MAKTEVTQWDPVADNNLDVNSISLAENVMRPPAVNNSLREIMAQIRRLLNTSIFRLFDTSDPTKLLAFDLSAIPTATTRTNAFPSYAGGMSVEARGTAIVAAATTDLSAATGNFVHVTGNTTITSLGTAAAGISRKVIFDGAPLLTNGANLLLPNGVDLRAAAGDSAIFVSEGSGAWKCIAFTRAASTPYLALGTVAQVGSVPTGAAMERGSNANGTWSRFADGTQICTHTIAMGAPTAGSGAVFVSAPTTWTFPIAFLGGSSMATSINDSQSEFVWFGIGQYSSTNIILRCYSPTSSATTRTVNVIAVGRWF